MSLQKHNVHLHSVDEGQRLWGSKKQPQRRIVLAMRPSIYEYKMTSRLEHTGIYGSQGVFIQQVGAAYITIS